MLMLKCIKDAGELGDYKKYKNEYLTPDERERACNECEKFFSQKQHKIDATKVLKILKEQQEQQRRQEEQKNIHIKHLLNNIPKIPNERQI